MGDDAWPKPPSETVGWEMGARTCLHVRPGRLTILECRFNKTTHHQQSKKLNLVTAYEDEEEEDFTQSLIKENSNK